MAAVTAAATASLLSASPGMYASGPPEGGRQQDRILQQQQNSSGHSSGTQDSAGLTHYRVRAIPPHRASANAQQPSSSYALASSSSSRDASKIHTMSSTRSGGADSRERRQSQISNRSSDSRSRRNSGLYTMYPSPAPSSPTASPTNAQGSFTLTSSPTMPAMNYSSFSMVSPTSPMTSHPAVAAPSASSSSSISPSSSSYIPRSGSGAVYLPSQTGISVSGSMSILQGIEAQMQIPPFRGGPSATAVATAVLARSHSTNATTAPGSPYGIPGTYHSTHRPASAAIGGLQSPVQLQNPAHLYLHQGSLSQSVQPALQTITAPSDSSHYTPMQPSASAGPASTQFSTVSAGNARNRASHQITSIAQAPQPINIALHTAQYSNPNRPKIYFGDYQLLQTLGEGEFGKVKLGVHVRRWGEEVAIKLIKRGSIENTARHMKVQREIDVLKSVRHPHIVRLHEVIETEKYIGIVLEYASGGELFEFILAHKYLKEPVAVKLFAQLVSGVAYLHSKRIVHRDLKLENLLLDRRHNIVITDFGFANRFNDTGSDLMATSCGSPCYAAPELVLHDGSYVGSAVDVWSCGVILYAMLSGYLPYDDDPANPDGDNINLLYKYITSTELTFPKWLIESGEIPKHLLQMMLVADPTKRCTLRDVMAHPWLKRYQSFFSFSVNDLEAQADYNFAEKAELLRRQQMEHFRSHQVQPAPPGMSRSMTTPAMESLAQQRHRSAIVQPVTIIEEGARPLLPSAQIPLQPVPSSGQRHAQPAALDPLADFPSSCSIMLPPLSMPPVPSALPTAPYLNDSHFSSLPMTPASSRPGDTVTIPDPLTFEGDLRGEPRIRRKDDDDTSSSSNRTQRTSVRGANVPVVQAIPTSPDSKKRKNEEKRYSVQLEYTSPPSESTRSKTRARESTGGANQRTASGGMSMSYTMPQLPNAEPRKSQSSSQASLPAGTLPAVVEPADRNIPIVQAAAAAESIDVHMQSPQDSPARSYKDASDMSIESVHPTISVQPAVSPVRDRSHPAARDSQSQMQTTPPVSPQLLQSRRTPTRPGSTHSAHSETTPRSARPDPSPRESQVPFPSPKADRRAAAAARAETVRVVEGRPPTASSHKSSTRHKKGLSISRLLGSSTASIDKTETTGAPNRSSRNSASADRSHFSGIVASPSATTFDEASGVAKPNRRRKALSLMVDPFNKSLTGPSTSAMKNRRSARVQTLTSAEASAVPGRSRNESATTVRRHGHPVPTTTASSPVSPSLTAVHANASRQSVVLQPGPLAQVAADGLARSTSSRSKRVSDWFRFRSSTRDSLAINPMSGSTVSTVTDHARQHSSRRTPHDAILSRLTVEPPQEKRLSTSSARRNYVVTPQPALVVSEAPSLSAPTYLPVVSTAAEARNSALLSARMTRARTSASGDEGTLSFDESKLKVHSGPTDRRIVTKSAPPLIMQEVKRVISRLNEMGMEVIDDNDYRIKITRKSRKQAATQTLTLSATERRGMMPSPLSPSPSSTFRSFFGRKNSTATQNLLTHTPTLPSPALTSSSHMLDSPHPESSALAQSMTSSSTGHCTASTTMPFYGIENDSGGEVRFTVEVTRVKNLNGLYTLDLRRLKGSLPDYRENHETFLGRLRLADAL